MQVIPDRLYDPVPADQIPVSAALKDRTLGIAIHRIDGGERPGVPLFYSALIGPDDAVRHRFLKQCDLHRLYISRDPVVFLLIAPAATGHQVKYLGGSPRAPGRIMIDGQLAER